MEQGVTGGSKVLQDTDDEIESEQAKGTKDGRLDWKLIIGDENELTSEEEFLTEEE